MAHHHAVRLCSRYFLWGFLPWLVLGCTESSLRLQSNNSLEEVLDEVVLLRDVTGAFGGHPMEIQAIGLVANLDGTGGDPPPSGFRQMLVTEMQKRGVDSPGKILASPSTALVLARAELPPHQSHAGIQFVL